MNTSAPISSWKSSRLRHLPQLSVLVGALATAAPASAGLVFVNTFDNTWSAGLKATATAAATRAEALLSSWFTNNVTVAISFQATAATGLADANFNGLNFPAPYGPDNVSYATIKADLAAHSAAHPENTALASALAHLPATISCPNCNAGAANFLLPDAQKLALTGSGAGYAQQGFIRLNPNFSYDTDPTNGIGAGQIDLTAVFLHEITHVMGRVDYSFADTFGNDPFLTVLDLDRFTCGTTTRNFTYSNACFSIDGGATDLRKFSDTSDTGDWDSAVVSANNAFLDFGTAMGFQTSDILTMNALGWDPVRQSTTVPEPASLALMGIALAGLASSRRRKQ